MSSTLTDLTAATTWSGTDLFYALVGGNSRKIAASKFLVGEASNVLAQVDSTTAQVFRVYRTFTDSSNYERLALQSGSGYMELAAETAGTGTDNIGIRLTPSGTGVLETTASKMRLGTTTEVPVAGIGHTVQITNDGNVYGLTLQSFNASGFSPAIVLSQSRTATVGNFGLVEDTQELGRIDFFGADGDQYIKGASIRALVDGTAANNDLPTKLVFSTTADGASSPTEYFTIRPNGACNLQWGLGVPAGGAAGVCFTLTSNTIGVYVGSGAPTVSAQQGSLYLRSDGSSSSTRLYVNSTGSTTWVNVTTAS